jgi:hypothetical protein
MKDLKFYEIKEPQPEDQILGNQIVDEAPQIQNKDIKLLFSLQAL